MAAERSDSLSGAHLGKEYWVVDRIGDGGMGVVYVVEHRGLKKQFAAKILSRELTENAEARARFEIEARAASQLDHENIVNVTDYGVATDGRPFLVMELLRGKTLFSRLNEGPMTLGEAAAVIVPVCAALGAAHEAGIVHRDIKPENVFLVQRPGGRVHVKVLDFGIAKASMDTPRVTKLGQVLGSPLYMAPEACKGEDVDPRADIYSVGILLYQLTTGHLPFEDSNMLRLLQLHALKPVPPPRKLNPALSPEIEAVVLRALEKDREARFQSIEELAHALMNALPEGADLLLRTPVLTPPPLRTPHPSPSRQALPDGRTPLGSPALPRTTPTINMHSGTVKLGPAAAHAMLEGGPTLMAEPSGPTPAPATAKTPAPDTTIQTRLPPTRRTGLAVGIAVVAIGAAVAVFWPRSPAPSPAAEIRLPPAAPVAPVPAAPIPAAAITPAESAPVPAARPTRVRVRVTSTPAGAPVRIAGEELGVTPLDVEREAASGTAPLELRHKGRWRTLREVALDADVDLDIGLAGPERPRRSTRSARPDRGKPDPTAPSPDLEIRGRR